MMFDNQKTKIKSTRKKLNKWQKEEKEKPLLGGNDDDEDGG